MGDQDDDDDEAMAVDERSAEVEEGRAAKGKKRGKSQAKKKKAGKAHNKSRKLAVGAKGKSEENSSDIVDKAEYDEDDGDDEELIRTPPSSHHASEDEADDYSELHAVKHQKKAAKG